MQKFLNKKCIPCEGGMLPFTADKIQKYVPEVPGWRVVKNKKIQREFALKNFKEAMAFINKVADLAEREGHHPDIYLHNWNKVRIDIFTHAIGGLSENDFILAAKMNELY